MPEVVLRRDRRGLVVQRRAEQLRAAGRVGIEQGPVVAGLGRIVMLVEAGVDVRRKAERRRIVGQGDRYEHVARRPAPAAVVRHRAGQVVVELQGEERLHGGVAVAPTRPIEPTRLLLRSVRMEALDRNWLPRSECTTVPAELSSAIALCSAVTAREAFIRSSMEWPTMRPE